MSDSGSTAPPPRIGQAIEPSTNKDRYKTAKIERLADDFRSVDRKTRLRGRIVQNRQNSDSSRQVKIRTDRGDIDVKVPSRDAASLPPVGDDIEVDLPRGNPPRQLQIVTDTPKEQATARDAQQQADKGAQRIAPPAVDVRDSSTAPKAEDDPDLDIITVKPESTSAKQTSEQQAIAEQKTLSRLASQPIPADAKPAPITEGQYVRLIAIDPAIERVNIASQIVKQTIETNLVKTLNSFAQPAPNIALNAAPLTTLQTTQPQIQTSPLNQTIQHTALQTASPHTVLSSASQNITAAAAPISSDSITLSQPPQPTTTADPTSGQGTADQSRSALSTQIITPPVLTAAATTPQTLIISPQNIDVTAPAKHKLAQFDAQIKTIQNEPLPATDDRTNSKAGRITRTANTAQTGQIQAIAHNVTGSTSIITKNIQAGQALGRITGFTSSNQPVLELLTQPEGSRSLFSIQFQSSNLSTGAEVTLSPAVAVTTGAAQSTANPGPLLTFDTMLQHFQWPAMQDLSQLIFNDPVLSAAQSIQSLTQSMPNPAVPSRIPAAALLFVAAMRGGDLSGWINDKAIDLLRSSGKGDLINRLSQDFGSLSRMSSEGSSTEWRMMPLPMNWQNDIQPIMLYYKRDENESDKEDAQGKKGTRFIFDLNLDHMGPVQLDGYYKERPDQKKAALDLILRTAEPLSKAMQHKMRETYIHALDYANINGEIGFQAKTENFITVDMNPNQKDQVLI